MKNGGFLFKIGRKLRPVALWTDGRTDGHLPPAYDINNENKYHTPPCYPYMMTTKRRNTIRANARAETRLRRKLKRANARAERA